MILVTVAECYDENADRWKRTCTSSGRPAPALLYRQQQRCNAKTDLELEREALTWLILRGFRQPSAVFTDLSI